MSREIFVDMVYERRARIRAERIRETTESFLDRYDERLRNLDREGLTSYVQGDVDEIRGMLREAYDLLDSDPDEARGLSMAIGDRMRGLGGLARSIQRDEAFRRRQEEARRREEARQAEYERRRELREEQKAFVQSVGLEIEQAFRDPVAYDFARDRISALRARYAGSVGESPAEIQDQQVRFRKELSDLAEEAGKQAAEWKASRKAGNAAENAVEKIEDDLAVAARKSIVADGKELAGLISSLEDLKRDVASRSVTAEEAVKSADRAVDDGIEAGINEQVRLETLTSLAQTLKELGFIITGDPTYTDDGGVRLHALRPNGQQGIFIVRADGGLHYRLDQYEGSACKKDLAALTERLKTVYGIEFSNERVIWENPDEIGKDTFRDGDGLHGKGAR